MQRHTTPGFTLIELSIVLVIIGLVLGGVLAGKDLIHGAQIRNAIRDKERFTTATNTFISKYNCIPGDCAKAYNVFGTACGNATSDPNIGCNGNGDGLISDFNEAANAAVSQGELFKFWLHMSLARLIPGSYSGHAFDDPDLGPIPIMNTNIPGSSLKPLGWNAFACPNLSDPSVSAPNMIKGNYFSLGGPSDINFSSGLLACNSLMARQDAYDIDKKVDDGAPQSGHVFGDGGIDCGGSTYFTGESMDTTDCTLSFKW